MIKSFRDLDVYKRSKETYLKLVKATRTFPSEGKHLANQLNRAGNSIHSNIAEGFGRSNAEFKQYLARALGSNNEVLSHLEDAIALEYLKKDLGQILTDEYTIVGKQLYRLRENWK